MMTISVKPDTKDCVAMLNSLARNQVPYAMSVMVTDIAFQVQRAEIDNIQKTFKHPRPYTTRSVRVIQATVKTLTAIVYVIPEVAKYLLPYETGGLHVLPGPALLNPKGVSLDQYGQITQRMRKALKQRPDIFVATIHGVTGFFRKLAKGKVRLLVEFGVALPVNVHLNFHRRALEVARAAAPGAWDLGFSKAIARMKPRKAPTP
jgi:hypothetical protein